MNPLLWLVNCTDIQSALLADYLRDRGFDLRHLNKTAVYGPPPKNMPLPGACLIFGSQNSEPLIHRMRSWGFDAPLLFLFQYGGTRDCISVLDAGADECVHMPISHPDKFPVPQPQPNPFLIQVSQNLRGILGSSMRIEADPAQHVIRLFWAGPRAVEVKLPMREAIPK